MFFIVVILRDNFPWNEYRFGSYGFDVLIINIESFQPESCLWTNILKYIIHTNIVLSKKIEGGGEGEEEESY